MVRKSLYAGFSYLAGLICACVGWGGNSLVFALFAFGSGAVLFFMSEKYRIYIVFCTFFVLLGIGIGSAYTVFHYNRLISLDGQNITIKGYVQDFSYVGSDKCRLRVTGKINGHRTTVDFYADNYSYDYYDKIEITAKVYKITDSINYLGETYNRPKGIFLKGGEISEVVKISGNSNPLFREVKHYRDYIFDRINDIAGGDEGAFLGAMLCGDKTQLSEKTKSVLYRSGLGHIFAVSGTHLVLITSVFSFFLSKLLHSVKARFWLLTPVIWGFAVFAGMSPSVVRAAVMMTILKGACLFAREPDNANSLGFAAVLLTAFSPYTAVDISFLMSFSAAFAVGVAAPKVNGLVKSKKAYSGIIKSFLSSCVILFVTMPVVILFFGGASLVSPIANVILLPVCAAALVLTFFAALLSMTAALPFLLALAKTLVKTVFYGAELLESMPFSYITAEFNVLKILMIFTCLIPIITALCRKNIKSGAYSAIAVLMCWCVCGNILKIMFKSDLRILILPDGKNAQAAVVTGNNAVIIDMNCKGSNNSGMQRLITAFGLDRIYCAFIKDSEIFTVLNMNEDFIPKPDNYAVSKNIQDGFEKMLPFQNGFSMEFNNAEISFNNDVFTVFYKGKHVVIDGSLITLDNRKYDLSGETYPCEIIMNDTELRRLDYGFGKSN